MSLIVCGEQLQMAFAPGYTAGWTITGTTTSVS